MHYLRSKKIIFIFFLAVIFLQANAQNELFNTAHDQSKYFFGLSIGFQSSELNVRSDKPSNIFSTHPITQTSFAVGLFVTKRLTNNLQIRIDPQILVGGQRSFTYTVNHGPPQYQILPSTILNFPFHIKYLTNRDVNFRAYIFGGPKVDYDFSQTTDKRKDNGLVQLYSINLGYEVGVGITFYWPFMTLSPEIKFSNGLSNLYNSNQFSAVFQNIKSINANVFAFSLIFED